MSLAIKILFLEDNAIDARFIELFLRERSNISFEMNVVSTKEEFESALKQQNFDVILCDHVMAQFNSLDALKMTKAKSPFIPFIVVSGSGSEQDAAKIIEQGADAYVSKDNLQFLPAAIIKAIGNVDK